MIRKQEATGKTVDEARAKACALLGVQADDLNVSYEVLDMPTWQTLADKLVAAGTKFVIEPYIRFKGEPGEQATMFFMDPSGNALEFKAFNSLDSLFAK